MTGNQWATGDQHRSGYIELNEEEISNASAVMDPNETQLPAGVFKFPAHEIMESVNVEFDEKYNVEGAVSHSASPKTPTDILEIRLKEYECLMEDLRTSTKAKSEAQHELMKLKQENAGTANLKTKLAETNAILEDLRIKHGNEKEKLIEAKERLRESMKENLALKTIKARKKETEKDLEQQMEELKRQLRDAEATVAKYRSRQEKVDKKLRSELAKTHNVLKKTKANLNECKEQVPS